MLYQPIDLKKADELAGQYKFTRDEIVGHATQAVQILDNVAKVDSKAARQARPYLRQIKRHYKL